MVLCPVSAERLTGPEDIPWWGGGGGAAWCIWSLMLTNRNLTVEITTPCLDISLLYGGLLALIALYSYVDGNILSAYGPLFVKDGG